MGEREETEARSDETNRYLTPLRKEPSMELS